MCRSVSVNQRLVLTVTDQYQLPAEQLNRKGGLASLGVDKLVKSKPSKRQSQSLAVLVAVAVVVKLEGVTSLLQAVAAGARLLVWLPVPL